MNIPLTIRLKTKHENNTFAFFLCKLKRSIIPAIHDDIEKLLQNPDVINLMEKCWYGGYNIGNSIGYEAGYDDGWEANLENDYYE